MGIENQASFWAAVLAFVGTVIIVMDSFMPVHRIIDRYPKWENINLAMTDLDTFDTKMADGKMNGMVEKDKPGFRDFKHIICSKRPSLQEKTITAVVKNKPFGAGGVPFKIVHVAVEGNSNAIPLTTDYIFQEWVRDYRAKCFLKIGLSIIALAFLLSVFAHIDWKANRAGSVAPKAREEVVQHIAPSTINRQREVKEPPRFEKSGFVAPEKPTQPKQPLTEGFVPPKAPAPEPTKPTTPQQPSSTSDPSSE